MGASLCEEPCTCRCGIIIHPDHSVESRLLGTEDVRQDDVTHVDGRIPMVKEEGVPGLDVAFLDVRLHEHNWVLNPGDKLQHEGHAYGQYPQANHEEEFLENALIEDHGV